jgi:pimeloyl-ACP methyl ester carboxylesterase
LEREAERYRGNRHTREGRARQVAAEQQYDVRDRLSEITVPTLVLHGAHDPLVAVRDSELIASSIPNARLQIIEGAGHLLFLERPDESDRMVREFVSVV